MLSAAQIVTLEALVNRIIPADEYPCGWEAGVGDYLFGQFKRDLKHLLPVYALGLDALDAEAQAEAGQGFAQLAPDAQDALLTRVEAGDVRAAWGVDPVAFFRMVVDHCAEGYYADPGNGGNRDMVSWQMVGFEVNG
jgi:hypothetical protein